MAESGSRLSAALLLGGGLRPSPLGYAVGTSVLDLEITPGATVAQRWLERWGELPTELRPGVVRCLVARGAPPPKSIGSTSATPMPATVELDQREFCGPAGAVRDAVADMSSDEVVVVHEGATFAATSMEPMIERHFQDGAAATVGMNPDGSPAGVYLLRASLFREVSAVGFTDLKEQFLDRLRFRGVTIRVFGLAKPGVLPLRTRADFLRAAHAAAGRPGRASTDLRPALLAGEGQSLQDSTLSAAARVASGARVVGSVIMSGSSVDDGAIVVRSIICPGAGVGPGQQVIDTVVAKDGARTDAWASARARWRQKA